MLSWVAHSITGYTVVRIEGVDKERFINLAIKSGIRFWHYHRDGESYIISMRRGDYLKLRPIKRRCGVKISLVDKKGLPFIISPFRKRLGFFVGIIFGIVLITILSGRVWVLDASGSNIHSVKEILSAAEDAGVYVGASYDDFDPIVAANKIMLTLGDVKWVSVNTDGITADIAVRDSDEKPDNYQKTGIWNVVAKESGIIRYVEAQDGMISVKRDEAVVSGQVLITGIWETYDKWGEKTGNTFFAPARGTVLAETTRNYKVQKPIKNTVIDIVEEKELNYLYIFGFKIPLGFISTGDKNFELQTEENYLYLAGTKMPLGLFKDTYIIYDQRETEFTDDEIKTELEAEALELAQSDIGEKGSVILSEFEYTKRSGKIYLDAEFTCLEDIGEEREVLVDLTKEE